MSHVVFPPGTGRGQQTPGCECKTLPHPKARNQAGLVLSSAKLVYSIQGVSLCQAAGYSSHDKESAHSLELISFMTRNLSFAA